MKTLTYIATPRKRNFYYRQTNYDKYLDNLIKATRLVLSHIGTALAITLSFTAFVLTLLATVLDKRSN